ncbi:MAG: hypothetical protein JSV16_10915 [Candidatus Hydrogenedentota bacterium]|nr:MAG: hypothetical protein JSV16_10915 [Candidatus Hydrogenedentota bacterium]
MNNDYMDELISDIQQYLRREEDEKGQEERWVSLMTQARSAVRTPLRHSFFVGVITLLSASAVGSVTVAILLLGIAGGAVHDSVGTIWLLAGGGCGIFFSAMLVSVWKRLVILTQIEENTRLILASRRKTNALLKRFIQNMT